jgi:hypothetical protein
VEPDFASQLIDRVGVLRQPAELDLLIFFARHPRTLMTSQQIAAFVGYGPQLTAESLEVLLGAGLITRSQKPPHAARFYVFAPAAGAEWIHEVFELATTRPGRLALRRALAARSPVPAATLPQPAGREVEARVPRPFLLRVSDRDALSGEQREEA